MAVDSAAKRYSVLNFGNPVVLPLIIPDGTVASADKYHFLNLYSGISLLAAPVFSGTIEDISLTVSTNTTDYDLSTYFSGATSYSIAPSVETGWTFNTSTGVLTVLPDTEGTFGTYVVTGSNAGGTDDSNAFNVIVTTGTKGGAGTAGLGKKKPKKREAPPKEVFELKPIGELNEAGDLVLYTDLQPEQQVLQTELDTIAEIQSQTNEDIDAINQNLNFLRVLRKRDRDNKLRVVIVNTLDMFLEEEALLLLLLANNQ